MKQKKTYLFSLLILAVFSFQTGCSQSGSSNYIIKVKELKNQIINETSAFTKLSKIQQPVWDYAKMNAMDFKTAYDEMMGTRPGSLKLEMNIHKGKIMVLRAQISPPKKMVEVDTKLNELLEMYISFYDFMQRYPKGSESEFKENFDIYMNDINDISLELEQAIKLANQ